MEKDRSGGGSGIEWGRVGWIGLGVFDLTLPCLSATPLTPLAVSPMCSIHGNTSPSASGRCRTLQTWATGSTIVRNE